MVTGCYVHVSSDMWTVHTYRYTFEFMFKIHSRVLHQTTGSIIWVLDVGEWDSWGRGYTWIGVYGMPPPPTSNTQTILPVLQTISLITRIANHPI